MLGVENLLCNSHSYPSRSNAGSLWVSAVLVLCVIVHISEILLNPVLTPRRALMDACYWGSLLAI
jgi:hypothetical protein